MDRIERVDEVTGEHRRRKWSARVTEESNALDLPKKVFLRHDPKSIAASLKRSAEQSRRRKSSPFRSAMSMLTFYINRAGRNLPTSQKHVLEWQRRNCANNSGGHRDAPEAFSLSRWRSIPNCSSHYSIRLLSIASRLSPRVFAKGPQNMMLRLLLV